MTKAIVCSVFDCAKVNRYVTWYLVCRKYTHSKLLLSYKIQIFILSQFIDKNRHVKTRSGRVEQIYLDDTCNCLIGFRYAPKRLLISLRWINVTYFSKRRKMFAWNIWRSTEAVLKPLPMMYSKLTFFS